MFSFLRKFNPTSNDSKFIILDMDKCYNCQGYITDDVYDIYRVADKLDLEKIMCCSKECYNIVLQDAVIKENNIFLRQNKFPCNHCLTNIYVQDSITKRIDGRFYNVCNNACLESLKKDLYK